MQQCTQCSEPVPRGVLMVQHMTKNHLVPCSVVLKRTADDQDGKLSKKPRTGKLFRTNKKASAGGTSVRLPA